MGNLEFLRLGCAFGKYVPNLLKIAYSTAFTGAEFGWFDYSMLLFVTCAFAVDYLRALKEIDVNVLASSSGSDRAESKVVHITDVTSRRVSVAL